MELCRFASLIDNIHISADPTPVDVDHAVHAGVPKMCTRDDPPTLTMSN